MTVTVTVIAMTMKVREARSISIPTVTVTAVTVAVAKKKSLVTTALTGQYIDREHRERHLREKSFLLFCKTPKQLLIPHQITLRTKSMRHFVHVSRKKTETNKETSEIPFVHR